MSVEQKLHVASRAALKCQEWSKAGILLGSVVTSPEAVRGDSDVDILLLVDGLAVAAARLPFFSDGQRMEAACLIDRAEIDGLASKGQDHDTTLSFSVIGPKAVSDIGRLIEGGIRYYRTTKNDKTIRLVTFGGQSIMRKIECTSLKHGFVAEEPVTVTCNGSVFFGIAPDALINPVHVWFDDGSFASMYSSLWLATIAKTCKWLSLRDKEAALQVGEVVLSTKCNLQKMGADARDFVRRTATQFALRLSQ